MKHGKGKEFSKKIIKFTGILFMLSILFCVFCFGFSIYLAFAPDVNFSIDWTPVVTLLTVTGSAFGASAGFYYSKAKVENKFKIQSQFLKEKYEMLHSMGTLTTERAQQEIEDELSKMDANIDSIEEEPNEIIV